MLSLVDTKVIIDYNAVDSNEAQRMCLFLEPPGRGTKGVPSDPGFGGVMEYRSNGLKLREGF